MKKSYRAAIEFSLRWSSHYAQHNDRYFVDNIDFWRDIFPGSMKEQISKLSEGQSYSEKFNAGIVVPLFKESQIIKFNQREFDREQGNSRFVPGVGRFYPKSFAWRALNCYRGDITPFRITKTDSGQLVGDTNHPLAQFPLTLEASFIERLKFFEERGGTCNHIAEMVTDNGPGMQIRYPETATDFYSIYPFKRLNEDDDRIFYKSPRMVNHLDDMAISQVKAIYSRFISPGCRILDLMSSWVSHLPDISEDYKSDHYKVTGLGLNEEELRANHQLSDIVVQDLNSNHKLPFNDNEFDVVICTASIEYLVQPVEVINEVARVTKPGGVVITTFSDRWFPGKEIVQWSELHEFERLALVLDCYIKSGMFGNLHTESVRGLPRPLNDKYRYERANSDPIFAVWGTVQEGCHLKTYERAKNE